MLYDRAASPPDTGQPCWYCAHYGGPAWGDTGLARCVQTPKDVRCRAQAELGCAYFERMPGVDDDGWSPPAKVYKPLRPRNPGLSR